jgi:ribosome-associated toxin RatA of RatAB toxin-antitoxin module
LHSEISIWIDAAPERVFPLVADLDRWPERLPHYRYVRVLERSGGAVRAAMSARRGAIPVFWTAIQTPDRDAGRIRFRHVGGLTRGMEVLWTLDREEGGTRARITHDLDLRWPLVGGFLAERVIAPQFIEPIAALTLRRFKQIAEGAAAAAAGRPESPVPR